MSLQGEGRRGSPTSNPRPRRLGAVLCQVSSLRSIQHGWSDWRLRAQVPSPSPGPKLVAGIALGINETCSLRKQRTFHEVFQPIRSATKIWVVKVISMELLCSLLRHRFARAQVVTLWNIHCFLRLWDMQATPPWQGQCIVQLVTVISSSGC